MPKPTKPRTKAKAPRRKRSWRDIPDSVILALAPPTMGRAASLSPDENVMWGCCLNNPTCHAIVSEWKFRIPIIKVEASYAENSILFED